MIVGRAGRPDVAASAPALGRDVVQAAVDLGDQGRDQIGHVTK
jgi:hypothetical protein